MHNIMKNKLRLTMPVEESLNSWAQTKNQKDSQTNPDYFLAEHIWTKSYFEMSCDITIVYGNMSSNNSSHPTGNITKMLSTTPQNPIMPIKSRGGTGTSKFINFSTITNVNEQMTVPAITRAAPINVSVVIKLPSSVMLPDICDTRSALLPPIKTLTTIQNTPTQWNLRSKFFKT